MATTFATNLTKQAMILKTTTFNHIELKETHVRKGAIFSLWYILKNDNGDHIEDFIEFSEKDLDLFEKQLSQEEKKILDESTTSKRMHLLLGYYLKELLAKSQNGKV